MYICIYINHVQHNNNVYICIHILYIHMFIIFILYPFINDGYIYIYRSYITFLSIKTSFFLSLSRLSLYIPRHYLFIFLHFLTFSCTREPGFSIQFSAFARPSNGRMSESIVEEPKSVDPRKYIADLSRGSWIVFEICPASGSMHPFMQKQSRILTIIVRKSWMIRKDRSGRAREVDSQPENRFVYVFDDTAGSFTLMEKLNNE